jgi:glycosyltransferase involved in cell wall biosynthesis
MPPLTRSLYVDVTTSWEEAGRHAHGTTRTERGLVTALAAMPDAGVRFFRFDRNAGVFVAVPAEEAFAAANAAPLPDRRRNPRQEKRSRAREFGVSIETWFRTMVRAPVRRWLASRRSAPPAAPAAGLAPPSRFSFEPGSMLLFAGEMHRHDFAVLMRLRQSLDLAFAFVLYDLHNVLPPGDPRLADPDASDIPDTDFFLRQGALIFSISDFTTSRLQSVLDKRQAKGPPVRKVRLAGKLPERAAVTPVADLLPGGFVLTVGNIGDRKNQRMLCDIWIELAKREGASILPLVCAGRLEREMVTAVGRVRSDPALAPLIRFETGLDDGQLAWLYGNCRFTVFPSLSEGFGLPVAESLAYGKVCVASTAEAIPEAGQGVAIGIDPGNRQEWARVIDRLMRDDRLLAEQEADILKRFRPVRWADSVADILSGIAELRRPRP